MSSTKSKAAANEVSKTKVLVCNGVIYNETTDTTLTLQNQTCNGTWLQQPPQEIEAGTTGTFQAERAIDLEGTIIYQDASGATVTCSFDMPLIGKNSFSDKASPAGSFHVTVDPTSGGGYKADPAYTISD